MCCCSLNRDQRVYTSTLLFVISLVVTQLGCGKYNASVSGRVRLEGELLHNGTVKFTPKDVGAPAYGMISEDGSYALQTGREMGLSAGSYSVTVVALEQPEEEWQGPGPPPPGKPIVPLWYRDESTSGLDFEVAAGSNTIDLDLTRAPPASLSRSNHR